MKSKTKKKILFLLLLILSIVFVFMGQSYSKYISQINAKGIIDVAKWVFTVNGQTSSITNLNLLETYDETTLKNNQIAPGTSGKFDIVIDTTGSEVGIDYKVEFLNETSKPSNLEFKYGDHIKNNLKELEEFLKGNIPSDAENKTKVMTIEWNWKYEIGSTEEQIFLNDKEDTNDGKNLEQYAFDIIITGSQVEPIS